MAVARPTSAAEMEVHTENGILEIARLAGWVLVGNSTNLVCQAITVVTIAKVGGPILAGRYTLALSITAPIILTFAMQLRVVEATDSSGSMPFSAYFTLRLMALFLALGTISALLLYRADPVTTAAIIALVGIGKAIESTSDIARGAMQRLERMREFGTSQALRSFALPLCVSAGLAMKHSLALGCLFTAAAWLGVLLIYDVPVTKKLMNLTSVSSWILFEKGPLKRLFIIGAPLGLAAVMMSLRSVVPNYIIESYIDERALGIFGTLSYMPVAGALVIETVGQATMPRLAGYFLVDRGKYLRALSLLALAATAVGVASTFTAYELGRPILELFFGPEFSAHAELFTIIVIGASLTYLNSVAGIGLTAAQVFRPQALINGVLLLVTLVGGTMLIPRYGLQGAGILTIVTGSSWLLMQVSMLAWVMWRSQEVTAAREVLQVP